MPNNFHALSTKSCLEELKSSVRGLETREASWRLKKGGFNEIEKKKPFGRLKILLKQFENPFIYILFFAGSVSWLLAEHTNAFVIFMAVGMNVFIGFLQENKANNSLEKLREMVRHEALVLRSGQEKKIDAREVVPGDILLLEAGARIPADGRLLEVSELAVNEAILTGESFPAEKTIEKMPRGASLADRRNMIYAGTVVVAGRGRALVTAAGLKTEVGKISTLIAGREEEKTPLQLRLESLAKFLAFMFLSICFLVFLLGVWQGRGVYEMFFVSVALAVSSIPEGLLISLTLILALGMQRLLKNNVLTRKLISAETLGSTSVICSDKTGTLTEGRMSVSRIIVGEREFEITSPGSRQEGEEAKIVSLALEIGAVCNDALVENPNEPLAGWRLSGTPTEIALVLAASASGLDRQEILKTEPRLAEKQFTSASKFMLTLHQRGKKLVLYEKGAPEIILSKSENFYHQGELVALTSAHREKIVKNFENLTSRGLRVIAVAFKEMEAEAPAAGEKIDWGKLDEGLTLVGLIALKDPLRSDAREAIAEARRAGVRPVIITGDHYLTASAIAQEIGLSLSEDEIMTGEELDKLDDKGLEKRAGKISVYARVNPHHKVRIVSALRARGEIVAMAGDGVNDAPALKAADVGIALGTGTDVAKEASDMVLLDNNFKVIVLAVEEGRKIFSNLRKVVTYLISDAFCEIVLITGSIILNAPLAILPAQILWLNIIHDGLPNFSLAFEKGSQTMMEKKPRGREIPFLNAKMKTIIFGIGLAVNFIILIFFFRFWSAGADIDYLRTLIFAILGVKSLLVIFSLRSLSRPIWRLNPFGNPWVWGAIGISAFLFLLAIYWPPLERLLATMPLKGADWLLVLAFAALNLVLTEAAKFYFIRKEAKAILGLSR